jgi:hypothetical protein
MIVVGELVSGLSNYECHRNIHSPFVTLANMLLVAQAVVVVLKSIALKIQIFQVKVSSGLAS